MRGFTHLPPLPSVKDIIRLFDLRARKHLSQNFLLDLNLCRKIVRAAGRISHGWVCEVGPGPGGITRALLDKNPQTVVLIEKDQRFFPGLEMLNDASEGKLKVYHGDVMRFDMESIIPMDKANAWSEKTPNIHLVGNLPFSVSTPLIIRWLEAISERSGPWKHGRVRMTLTFQREVAERLAAPVLNKQRSRLSVMAQYLCDVRHEFNIPGTAFVPPPDVDVGVVHFVPRIEPLIDVPFCYVEKLVRHAFHYRQKFVKHGIRTLFPPDRPDLTEQMFGLTSVDPSSRPFMLTVEDMAHLCRVYKHLCDNHPGLLEYYYRTQEHASFWRRRKAPLNL